MTGRNNWARAATRDRMREHGTESISGARAAPRASTQRANRRPAESQHTVAEVDKFWRDRSGRAIVTRLTEWNGHRLVDLRTFYTADDGTMRPGKGLACSVRLLPQLARSIEKALAEARRLGLLTEKAAP